MLTIIYYDYALIYNIDLINDNLEMV